MQTRGSLGCSCRKCFRDCRWVVRVDKSVSNGSQPTGDGSLPSSPLLLEEWKKPGHLHESPRGSREESDVAMPCSEGWAKHRDRQAQQISVARGELGIALHERAKRTILKLLRVELTGFGVSNDVLR
jgi:hypothetical protein